MGEKESIFERFADAFDHAFSRKASWNIGEIKSAARVNLLRSFLSCMVISLIMGLINKWIVYLMIPRPGTDFLSAWVILLKNARIPLILFVLITLLAAGPMEVGVRQFYVEISDGKSPYFKEILHVFTDGYYLQRMIGMLVYYVVLSAGYMLLIVPGIVFSYMYKMVPYLLAEQPGMNPIEAMKLSRRMMQGNKWDAFLLDLSFWPWWIAEIVTMNLAGIAFGWPYRDAAGAVLYRTLEKQTFWTR